VLRDYRTAAVSPHVRAMLAYLEKMTLDASGLTAADALALKEAQVSPEAARDAVFVALCFNQIVRIADALGWEVVDEAGFAASAKSLLRFGYVLPFHRKGR
jgi:alkylhydroperoxidase family enzyme